MRHTCAHWRSAALVFLACYTLCPAAFAAGNAAAEALFERGRALMGEDKYEEACAAFEASQELEIGIGTLLYLGACYEKQQKTATAWATFREAQALAASRQDERLELAIQRVQALEPRLSRVVVHIPEANRLEGLEIKIDRQKIPPGSWGAAIPIDPGTRSVEVTAPGHEPYQTQISVAEEGGTHDLHVPLLEASRSANARASAPVSQAVVQHPTADKPSDSGSSQRMLAFSFGGASVVAIIAGSVLGIQAKRRNDDSKSECPNQLELCTPKGVELRDDARGYALGSNIAFGVGGALLATGVILYFTAPSKPKSTALVLRSNVHGSGAAMSLGGTF